MRPRKPLHALPAAAPEGPARIDLSPAELEGFAALRREEIALANRIGRAAQGVLAARGCHENETYDGVRGPDGAIVAFVRIARTLPT